ncbi:MAG: dTDP-4-dehydrorhamnose 3,5-epimerase family protein [Olsenella sp.]|jgi:hypothetical protein|nr:dTDP-4-dehydrorhamnose 3,5-epimerase family protein [Olsenella sp.]MCI1645858.1 dTDP-4-dehydrorhamnose 3,5-epimerase family protein [Olsenella sp.]MCI1810764.1 dTDP-4-dehydrorhamnose 3,5-epimerase family protein [Olsenella sp.]
MSDIEFEKELKVSETGIGGLEVVELPVHGDARGWFKENWQRAKMVALGIFDAKTGTAMPCVPSQPEIIVPPAMAPWPRDLYAPRSPSRSSCVKLGKRSSRGALRILKRRVIHYADD